jgi:hypothetical protein
LLAQFDLGMQQAIARDAVCGAFAWKTHGMQGLAHGSSPRAAAAGAAVMRPCVLRRASANGLGQA